MIKLIETSIKNPVHWYEIETDKGTFDIYANTRAQAVRVAKQKGYEVYSINMMG